MATEKLKFKLELYATYWDKCPKVDILINESVYSTAEINGSQKNPNVIEFEKELQEDVEYNLTIKRFNKTPDQCKIDESAEIIKDQLLHIKLIEIDEIDIGSLVYEGIYTPEYPEPWYSQQVKADKTPKKSLKNVTSMGHNGTWTFTFRSPFYMWLLENLY